MKFLSKFELAYIGWSNGKAHPKPPTIGRLKLDEMPFNTIEEESTVYLEFHF